MNKLQIILCMSLLTAFIGGCDSANENTGELNNNIQVIDKVSDSEPVSNTSSSVTESLPEVKDNPKKSIIKEKSAVFNLAEVEETYAGIKFKVSDISERSYGNGNALAVTFNVPLNPTQKFSQYLRVQRGDSFVDGDWILSESGKVAYFENIEPSSKYMLEVDRKIPSALGDRLHRTSSASIATRAMKPSITFASTGSFLPIDTNVGLPITTLNVPEINIDFHRIKSKNVIYVLREMNNTQNHRNYSIESVRKYGELAHSGRYEFSAKKNKRKNINIPLNDKKILNDPGLYVAVMTVPGSYESRIQATYFMVTDLGVHIRRYAQQTDIYINSLKTANPIKGVSIELLNNNGQRISDYTTDKDGLVSYKNRSDAHYLVASNNNSYSIITLKKSALDLSTFDLGIRPFKSHEVFIYTDRDLYRPGDNINFNAILRDFDGKKVRDTRISAKIKQANGQVVKNISWDSKGDGYYSYDYKIRSDAQVGSWTFEVSGIDDETVIYPFKVEEFLPERLKITFNENSEIDQTFTPRENVKIPVLGEYLYGAPAAGNRFDASISVKLQRHPFKDYKDFYFGNEEETQWNKNIKEKNKITDSEGKLLIEVPTRWQNTKSPLSVTIFGSLYETGGRPISRKHIATVLPDNGLIGIRPLFKENASVNDKAMFEIIKTNSKGEKLAVKDLDIILINEDRQYFWEYNNHRGWHYTNTEKEYSVLTISSDIEKDKTSIVGLPVVYGSYRVEILDKDTGYKTTYKFRAGHDWYYSWKKSQNKESAARPDKITLALDKEFYKAGEVAKLTMIPPSAGEALIIVEANSPLWSKRISLPKEGITVDIPVDKNWSRHDIYISVVNIRPANHDKKITPTRSFGLLHLPLNRENKKIDITIQAPEKWTPNQKVNVTLNVDNTNNKKTWITLSAVDVGILNITDYKTPDPHKFFFEPRRYQVDALDMYNRLIDLNDNDLAKLKFGGDAGDISHGGKQAKSEVQIVSLFSGLVEVKNGIANVELELPDFNGRLRMMAVAFNDDSVGSSEKEVTVAAPLVTQLSMPRFVAMGDQSTLALDLNNLSGNDVNINVKLSVNGAIMIEEKVETLTLLDKQMKTLHYPFDVGFKDVPSIISLNVSGIENYEINREWTLNVRSPYPAITKSIDKILKPNESLLVKKDLFNNYMPNTLQGSLTVSNAINLNMRDQMSNLLRYPYGCLEQSTSSTYPWVYADKALLTRMDIKNKTNKTQAENISAGLDRIMKKQKSNGGFGLWSRDSKTEEHWLTVYAADFFTDVRQKGFQVDKQMYDKTMNRLKNYLSSSTSYSMRWSSYPDSYRFSYRAYAGYVLSRHNGASLGHLRSLFNRKDDSRSFLSLVHLSLALYNQGDTKLSKEAFDLAMLSKKRRSGYMGDYGSEIRDIAKVIALLSDNKEYNSQVIPLSVELASLLNNNNYLSTQERNSVFIAAIKLDNFSGNEWKADVEFATAKKIIKSKGSQSLFIGSEDLSKGLILKNTSENVLYSTLHYSGYGTAPPAIENSKGLYIERSYYSQDGKKIDPKQLTVGDLIMVGLRVSGSNRMPDLMVVDLLPAGLELENQNLKHSAKLDKILIDGEDISYWVKRTDIVHKEYRDDRYVAAINLNWIGQTHVFYLARAVTPGVYKVPAPYAEDMYKPEIYAIGKTPATMTVSQ